MVYFNVFNVLFCILKICVKFGIKCKMKSLLKMGLLSFIHLWLEFRLVFYLRAISFQETYIQEPNSKQVCFEWLSIKKEVFSVL